MDPRIADRRRTVREQEARGSMARFLVVLVILGLAALGAWILFRSPLLSIDRLEVTGTMRSDPSAALAASGLMIGRPMITADLDAAQERIEQDPWVGGLAIQRRWPDLITVRVTERVGVAVVDCGGSTVLAAEDGTVLPSADPNAEQVGRASLGSVACDLLDRDLGSMMALEFLAALPPRIARGTAITTGEEGMIATIGGYLVRLGSADRGAEKARALVAVLNHPPEPGSVITLIAPTRPAVLPPQSVTSTTEPTTQP